MTKHLITGSLNFIADEPMEGAVVVVRAATTNGFLLGPGDELRFKESTEVADENGEADMELEPGGPYEAWVTPPGTPENKTPAKKRLGIFTLNADTRWRDIATAGDPLPTVPNAVQEEAAAREAADLLISAQANAAVGLALIF